MTNKILTNKNLIVASGVWIGFAILLLILVLAASYIGLIKPDSPIYDQFGIVALILALWAFFCALLQNNLSIDNSQKLDARLERIEAALNLSKQEIQSPQDNTQVSETSESHGDGAGSISAN